MRAGLLLPMPDPSSTDGGGDRPGDPIEPLEWTLWRDSLARLSRQHDRGAPLETSLRLASYLAILAPSPFAQIVRARCDEQLFEKLLDEAEYDAAVMCLMGRIVSFEVARRPRSSEVAARVWLVECPEEGRAMAHSAASALFAAWLDLLASLGPVQRPLKPGSPSRDRSRSRSERHRERFSP